MSFHFPTITYVIPTLNSASTLDMTLFSLKSQRDINLEILVVDSGSTDKTLEICKKWNIKSIYVEAGNMYKAINTGLKNSSSKWLGYINSDDWLYYNSVYRLIAKGEEEQASVVYGDCDYTDEEGRFIYSFFAARPKQLISLFKYRIFGFAQQSAIFTSDFYHAMNGFNEKYLLSSDADFYVRGLQANHKFSYSTGKSVSCFRIHQNQLSNTKSVEMELEKNDIYSELEKINISDVNEFIRWRTNNSLQYLIRLLRQSTVNRRFKVTNSMSIYQ